MISENRLPLFKMRTHMEGGGQILVALLPETGAGYRAKNREIKSRNRFQSRLPEFNLLMTVIRLNGTFRAHHCIRVTISCKNH